MPIGCGGQSTKGSAYLRELRGLLHGAMVLKTMQADLPIKVVRRLRKALEDNARRLLSKQPGVSDHDPGNEAQRRHEEKLRQRLAKQQDHRNPSPRSVWQALLRLASFPLLLRCVAGMAFHARC